MTARDEYELLWGLVEILVLETIDKHYGGNEAMFYNSLSPHGQALLDEVVRIRGTRP